MIFPISRHEDINYFKTIINERIINQNVLILIYLRFLYLKVYVNILLKVNVERKSHINVIKT
jgi:hypothetical protein